VVYPVGERGRGELIRHTALADASLQGSHLAIREPTGMALLQVREQRHCAQLGVPLTVIVGELAANAPCSSMTDSYPLILAKSPKN
jgi:hypothetical protein